MNKIVLAATMALAFTATNANATVALTLSDTTGQILGNPPFTLGWRFTVNSNITVNGLGFFDDAQNGLAEAHAVGLWNAAGTLLASTTIGAGTVSGLINQFRYNSVAATALTAGQRYTIGALYTSGSDAVLFNANNVATNAAITYGNGTFAGGGTLANPSTDFASTTSFFGPNFTFGAVPEPASWAMLLMGFGVMGGALRRRRTVTVTYA